jgi:uroporphyrinogen-III synthase
MFETCRKQRRCTLADMAEVSAPHDPYAGAPLTGCVVAITAHRRRAELASLLERRGAKVMSAPTMRIVPLGEDAALRAATEACLADPQLDYVVATTGIGWRGWMNAAESWGLDGRLRQACAGALVLARGPKATGAVRASGLREAFSGPTEASPELLTWLLERPLAGARVAVQRHGSYDAEFMAALGEAGAEVIDVPVYRWAPPADQATVDRLVDAIARREVHAVAFTSAPGAAALLEAADRRGKAAAMRAAFGSQVLAAAVGEICATPLVAAGLPSVWPDRGRLGSLVRLLTDELPARLRLRVATPRGPLVLQGNSAAVGDTLVELAPQQAAVLRELTSAGGRVVSRRDLLDRVWSRQVNDHVVEVTVGRLRTSLGEHADLILTVPKRGYRLATEPGG